MTIQLAVDMDVELVDYMGSDEMICKAARVSTIGAASIDSGESSGLINFLMKNRHGTPFEHNSMTFRISCPIFVWREFMRHRIGFSYNEESGRYKVLEPKFYVPHSGRNLVQVGKPGAYTFELGTRDQFDLVRDSLEDAYERAWFMYQRMLREDIAKEVARMCLPVSIYSTAYVTCNARSMMSFLSLRTKRENSTYPSFPMQEINQVANQMEYIFKLKFPITFETFNNNGRVCP
jgi:flavin-dependent thymidylate synthase